MTLAPNFCDYFGRPSPRCVPEPLHWLVAHRIEPKSTPEMFEKDGK